MTHFTSEKEELKTLLLLLTKLQEFYNNENQIAIIL